MSSTTSTTLGTLPVSALTAATAAALGDLVLALQADESQNPPQMVPRLASLLVIMQGLVGTGENTLAAGDDARIVNAAQTDTDGNLPLKGSALTLGGGQMSLSVDNNGHVTLTGTGLTVSIPLPTADPLKAGQWWNNGQYVCISTGAAS